MGKKYKKKKNNYRKKYRVYRKNPNRSVVERFNKRDRFNRNYYDIEIELDDDIKNNELIFKLYKIRFIFAIVSLVLVCCLFLFLNYPFIELVGDKNVVLKYNTEYVDEGAKGIKCFFDISDNIKINNEVDINKVGKYKITYSYSYFGFEIKKIRNVEVIDDVKPSINLVGDVEVKMCPNDDYIEKGFKAIDEYDGDLTDKVVTTINGDKIIYFVEDSSGNSIEVSRNLFIEDKESPSLTLKGNKTIYIYRGNKYHELGYSAIDNCDGDITNNVKINNSVNINKVGSYTIEYKISDSSGNTSIEKRVVIVRERITSSNNGAKGVIYLTFDDGPSNSITSKLLDILKEENVKATFFVISGCSNFNSLVKREYDEGHTVALHSYTHQYDKIYKSEDSYFDDLNKIRERVYNVTGEKSNIIRFPGGSSNTVSKKYSVGIMSILTSKVNGYGYHYFDWNISSGDAGGVDSSEEVYNNVVNNLSPDRSNVVLMHDFENNYYTLNAIRDIIQYGKNNGYTFSKITMDTNEVHHKVIN